ncbi:aldehyde dehydrogenase family protein [Loktanella sp. M215]|uniref:aldehyde dehydrogenase family protein n=1 Tax=Loktanella sp. M215 TaxID=2675431 RepID=UPI001F1AC2CE|nr:aldehyde dehydrogenase family protein [Loktanella sp. M215]MCF7700966.1 aldehyde dehydrogenase family protein [Loktanella sp. M215]
MDGRIEDVFAAQQARVAQRRVTQGLAARRAALDDLRRAILARQDDIVAALAADFGKHEVEVRLTEILPVLQEISHSRRHLRRWMRPRRVMPRLLMIGTSARVVPQARGVAMIIAPWNFPFQLAMGPLVSALAAGCAAIVKPSEMTPATSALVAEIVAQTFAPDLVSVVQGGADVATALLALPFDHIFFTGSPAVGRIVMAAAAQTLASVTLELGGKSPVIVGPDADVGRAAKWIAWGRFMNAGQTCVAPDHVFVHDSKRDALVRALQDRITAMYGSDPVASPALARIVDQRNLDRLTGLLQDAQSAGATLLGGGTGQAAAGKLAPVLVTGTTAEMTISGTEIFGPILPLIPYDDLDQVLARINAAPHPLALYVFGGPVLADRVMRTTTSGSVGVNLTVMPFIHAGLPFGGVGTSGMGAAHGHAGFKAFSHMRPVLRNRFLVMPLLFPPYTDRVRRLATWVQRLVT